MTSYCNYRGCPEIAMYGHKERTRCKDHKTDDMLYIAYISRCKYLRSRRSQYRLLTAARAPRCLYDNCTVTANYGYKTNMVKQYCKKHKQNGMIRLYSSMCMYEDCEATAIMTGVKELQYCLDHMDTSTVTIINCKSKCRYRNCSRDAVFGYSGQSKVFCNAHKMHGMNRDSKKQKSLDKVDIKRLID